MSRCLGSFTPLLQRRVPRQRSRQQSHRYQYSSSGCHSPTHTRTLTGQNGRPNTIYFQTSRQPHGLFQLLCRHPKISLHYLQYITVLDAVLDGTHSNLAIFSPPAHTANLHHSRRHNLPHSRKTLRHIALIGPDDPAALELRVSVGGPDDEPALAVDDGQRREALVLAKLARPAARDGKVPAAADLGRRRPPARLEAAALPAALLRHHRERPAAPGLVVVAVPDGGGGGVELRRGVCDCGAAVGVEGLVEAELGAGPVGLVAGGVAFASVVVVVAVLAVSVLTAGFLGVSVLVRVVPIPVAAVVAILSGDLAMLGRLVHASLVLCITKED